MCRYCDQIAPICAWRRLPNFENYCDELSTPHSDMSIEESAWETLRELSPPQDQEAILKAKEVARGRAPQRLAIFRQGEESIPKKEPPKPSNKWFDVNPGLASESEILFLALARVHAGDLAKEQLEWAQHVCAEEARLTEMGDNWSPSSIADWSEASGRVGRLIAPMKKGLQAAGGKEFLLQACKAIQFLEVPGHRDGMTPGNLKFYLQQLPAEPSTKKDLKKRAGVKRWKGRALVAVARLVKSHGPALRSALQIDMPVEELPTMDDKLALAKRQAAEAEKHARQEESKRKRIEKDSEKEQRALRTEVKRAKDAHRKAASRLNDLRGKGNAAKNRVEAERQKCAMRIKEARTRMKSRAREDAQRMAEQWSAAEVAKSEAASEKHRLERNAARRKARAEKLAKECVQRKLQRTASRLERLAAAAACGSSDGDDCTDNSDESDEDEVQPRRLSFSLLPRRDDRGRWQAESPEIHALRLAQLARGVAPSTISQNIQDVVSVVMPGVNIPATCERQNRNLRGEVTICGEAMAAWKFASCKRVISFGWDESTKFGDGVFACNARVEYQDGTAEDICLRGLSILAEGGTSKALLAHIEKRIFSHSRARLAAWKMRYDSAVGEGSWENVGYPSPESIGLHRLAEETVLMTDTCNGARCTKRMLADAINQEIRGRIGIEVWEAMSPDEREKKYKVIRGDCWQHLRNILIGAMAQEGNSFVKEACADSLASFSSFERVDIDGSCVIRSCFKQFHHGGEYAKGRGREFEAWRKRTHKSSLFIRFERAMGSRQDLQFDGCVPLFWNRIICLGFIRGYVDCPKSENILDRSLYTLLRCNEFVALLRANTLWKFNFSEPFRWLSGKTGVIKEWSLFKMSWVLDLVEEGMQLVKADPKLMFDPEFDMFAKVGEELPEFKEWRAELFETTATAEDGITTYKLVEEVLKEARNPRQGSGNAQATALTLDILKAQATRAVEKMHDKKVALADKLSSQDGMHSWMRNKENHKSTNRASGTNDAVENKFAVADFVMRTFRKISTLNTSGIIQQRTAHDFDRELTVISDRRKRKFTPEAEEELSPGGFFYTVLDDKLRAALLETARRDLKVAQKECRTAKQAHDNEKLSRREEALHRQLNAVVDRYAAALELFDQWKTQGVRDRQQLDEMLRDKSVNEQLKELRRQVEMRTVGCGWVEFSTAWSFESNERGATIEQWKDLLLNAILPHEKALQRTKKLPAAAAPPQLTQRTIKLLGTVDADAARLEAESLFNTSNLLQKAHAARAEREAHGVSDAIEAMQPRTAPSFDFNLIGKWLEICWPYKDNHGDTLKIWATGKVVRVADGLTDTRSPRARQVLPAGALLWAWEADEDYDEPAGERWMVLHPNKFNKHVQYAWRYDPRELLPPGAPRPPPRKPVEDGYATDEEFYEDWPLTAPRM